MNGILDSDGHVALIVLANVDPPMPEKMGLALSKALSK